MEGSLLRILTLCTIIAVSLISQASKRKTSIDESNHPREPTTGIKGLCIGQGI